MNGEYAIITGGSRGLGKWGALQCAKEGYDVVITYHSDRGQGVVSETLKEIESYGGRAIAVRGDVSKFEDCKKVVEESVAAFGKKMTILINNAGISVMKAFHEIEPEQIDKMIGVNLLSEMYFARLILPYMMENKKGWIINLSSNAGIMGVELFADYSASKGGVIAFTKALAKEAAPYGIKVNSIAPGVFLTDMTNDSGEENVERLRQTAPLKVLGDEEEFQLLVHYLINTKFTTGQIISPNGGWTI